MPSPQIQFRAIDKLAEALEVRAEQGRPASLVAQRDLERYYETLRRSMPSLTVGEASLLADVCNGTYWEPHTVTLLWANVADALDDPVAEKWGMSDAYAQDFVQRLRRLSYAECMALVDALERFWIGPYHKEGDLPDRLRAAGLIK